MLISQDGREQWVMRGKPQVCQRDDIGLRGTAWRHVAYDAALITGVEHALDGESSIGAGLHASSPKDANELLRGKRWNRQLVLHLLTSRSILTRLVDHRCSSSRVTSAAC